MSTMSTKNRHVIGVSANRQTPPEVLEAADFLEIKTITADESRYFRTRTDRAIQLHLQYTGEGEYLLPPATDFADHAEALVHAWSIARPDHVSFHLGPAAPRIALDESTFMAVALAPPLSASEIVETVERNLRFSKNHFGSSSILLENLEFIPEQLCGGAYRYVQEAGFFREHTLGWLREGLLDGIVFDIAHALITAGNHPLYNGFSTRDGAVRHPHLSLERPEPSSEVPEKAIDPGSSVSGDTSFEISGDGSGGTDEISGGDYIRELETDALPGFFKTYIRKMPLSLIREIHLSGIARREDGVWVDAHNEIGSLELHALKTVFEEGGLSPSGIPITLEYGREPDRIIPQIEMIRSFLNGI
jgi:uncharacterized protein (UPF0276 family)